MVPPPYFSIPGSDNQMAQNISIPTLKEEFTIDWFNLIFKPHGDNINITDVTWIGAANNGLGALSSLERIKLTVNKDKEYKIIIKCLPTDPNIRAYAIKNGFASREVNMYTRVFPDMEKFLKEKEITTKYQFRHPKCYFGAEKKNGDDDYNMILILEDMFDSKYKLWEDGIYATLDWAHTSTALEQLALFHAQSFAYRIVNGIENYMKIYPFLLDMKKSDSNLDNYIESGLNCVNKIFTNMESNGEIVPLGLCELLESQKNKLGIIIGEDLLPRPGHVSTICHNDLHTYNIFYSYQNESLEASWFDFQACFDGPPMKDVTFFLLACCDFSLSSTRMLETIRFYHDAFSEALIKMKVDAIYSFEEMKRDFEQNLFHSAWHIISCSPSWCARPEFEERLKKFLVGLYDLGYLKYPLQN